MVDERWYRVVLVDLDGTRYEVTGAAADREEAESLARDTIDYLNRVGRIDADANVTEIEASDAGPGFGFVMTTPDGRTIRK